MTLLPAYLIRFSRCPSLVLLPDVDTRGTKIFNPCGHSTYLQVNAAVVAIPQNSLLTSIYFDFTKLDFGLWPANKCHVSQVYLRVPRRRCRRRRTGCSSPERKIWRQKDRGQDTSPHSPDGIQHLPTAHHSIQKTIEASDEPQPTEQLTATFSC